MSMICVGVDAGKSTTKICVSDGSEIKCDSFPTATGFASDGRTDLLSDVHTFQCGLLSQDEIYKIGSEELPQKPNNSNSKLEKMTKTCTLYGIAKNVPQGANVNVAVGCPIANYKNIEERNEYCKRILPKGDIVCRIDGEEKRFKIENRTVIPESTGILALHPEYFNDPNYDAAIVDIGGLNMNITALNKGVIIIAECHTSQLGGRKLCGKLQTELHDLGLDASDAQIIRAIERGTINCHSEETKQQAEIVIADAVNSFVDEIDRELHRSWSNFSTYDLFFVGGTSFLIRSYLMERYGKFAHFEESMEKSQFANAEGFAIRLNRMLEAKPKQK